MSVTKPIILDETGQEIVAALQAIASNSAGLIGEGVPVGGNRNEVLLKKDNTNYNTKWGFPDNVSYSESISDIIFTNGKYVNHTTGGLTTQNTYASYSDYINVSGHKFVKIPMIYATAAIDAGCAFYNESKSFIGSCACPVGASAPGSWVNMVIPIPDGAVYMRTTWYNTNYAYQPDTAFYCNLIDTDYFTEVSEKNDCDVFWESGSISSTGAENSNNKRLRTCYIPVIPGNTRIIVTPAQDIKFAINIYYEDGRVWQYLTYWYQSVVADSKIEVPLNEGSYTRVIVKHGGSDVDFTEDEKNSMYSTFKFVYDSAVDRTVRNTEIDDMRSNVKSAAHRGYSIVAPENTLPAYILARKMGFVHAECDISFTSDSVPVLLHDSTINRTARNPDGTTISPTINISDISYDDLLAYDFGIWKSPKYAGTKIPTLSQFLSLCKGIGIKPYIEIKSGASQAQVESIANIVLDYGMEKDVTWISFDSALLGYVAGVIPTARLGYIVSSISASTISTAQGLKTSDNEVFIDSSSYTDAAVALCRNAGLPLEVWVIDTIANALNMPIYATGCTTNWINVGKVLYNYNMGGASNV